MCRGRETQQMCEGVTHNVSVGWNSADHGCINTMHDVMTWVYGGVEGGLLLWMDLNILYLHRDESQQVLGPEKKKSQKTPINHQHLRSVTVSVYVKTFLANQDSLQCHKILRTPSHLNSIINVQVVLYQDLDGHCCQQQLLTWSPVSSSLINDREIKPKRFVCLSPFVWEDRERVRKTRDYSAPCWNVSHKTSHTHTYM